ncbi:aldo/keto reductase [Paenibacillus sp. FSL H7-0331]|uniref:aldo/keto reductase n=1 Tax=Paenibacillus sp. FSL H7-0331 TaxID=1920421 RepID=UPI00096F62C8|nr:aldo/keto reductase [Paenibacillus sp. FSL H7-0331]OMF19151.1 oxidoreductase [Paenibacillus sp. FSL H7-0331]
MKYGYLGKSGLRVSRLCLGTAAFGGKVGKEGEYGSISEQEAFRIMDAALDAGINFFDTANVYGGVRLRGETIGHRGITEEIIGRWFAQGGNRRERVVLGTKVGRVFEEDELDGPNKAQGLSLYKIRRHFEASLKRLQTDHIELYQMHHVDRNVQWEELWEAFEGLVRSGKVDYIGSSNFAGRDLARAQSVAKERHFMGLISEQHGYNLLNRFPETDTLPTAKELGIGITIWSPLARGLLATDVSKPITRTLTDDALMLLETHRSQMEQFSDLCRELGEKEANVSLAWLLANPAVAAPVIGPSTVEELEDLLRSVEIELDASTMKRLDEIFPASSELSMFKQT